MNEQVSAVVSQQSPINTLIITNVILIGVFIFQKVISYLFTSHTNKNEKQEGTVDDLVASVSALTAEVSAIKAQLEIVLQQLFKFPKFEKDIHALAERVRRL